MFVYCHYLKILQADFLVHVVLEIVSTGKVKAEQNIRQFSFNYIHVCITGSIQFDWLKYIYELVKFIFRFPLADVLVPNFDRHPSSYK